MKQFHASAVERRIKVADRFASHPMEAGWASEAIFFLIVEEIDGLETVLEASVEISADGINWISEGTVFEPINKSGHYFAKVTNFGNWLRVKGLLQGKDATAKLSVQLHLKG